VILTELQIRRSNSQEAFSGLQLSEMKIKPTLPSSDRADENRISLGPKIGLAEPSVREQTALWGRLTLHNENDINRCFRSRSIGFAWFYRR
jgi:hypothetical protein